MRTRILSISVLLLLLLSLAAAGPALGEELETPAQVQDLLDTMIYGEIGTGGIIQRLGKVETDLFGRELPGSISERQLGLMNFIRNGTLGQPSMMFKTGLAEWAILHEARPDLSLARRIGEIERHLEGEAGEGRPLAMRLERLLALLFPGQLFWQDVNLPANLVFKASFVDRVSPKSAAVGDIVRLKLEEHLSVEGFLVAPRGSRVIAVIDRVKPPRSFGRPAEIKFAFDRLEPLGPEKVPVFLGDAAALATKSDTTVATALGTSVVGLALLGPVGLVGGLFVKGDAPDIVPGTPIYLETASSSGVKAYPVPSSLHGLLGDDKGTTPAEAQAQEVAPEQGQEGGMPLDQD
jgi:hypothetical protein